MKSFELKTPNSLIIVDVRLINKAFQGDFKMALMNDRNLFLYVK